MKMDLEKALQQYQETEAFAADCEKKKASFTTKYLFLFDDLTIERMVLAEKKQELKQKQKGSEKE